MSKADERREAMRLLRDGQVRARVIAAVAAAEDAEVEFECSTVDVSVTGLRLLLEQPLLTEARLALQVQLPEAGEWFVLHGVVRWLQETGATGVYLAGVHLLEDEDDDLALWRSCFF